MHKEIIALRTIVIASAILGALTFVGILLSQPAFSDIKKGEGDLTAEWFTVQATAFVTLLFLAVTFWLLAQFWILIGRARDEGSR